MQQKLIIREITSEHTLTTTTPGIITLSKLYIAIKHILLNNRRANSHFESNFRNATRTLDVKTKNMKSQICFILHRLLATVKFLSLVDIFSTSIAPTSLQQSILSHYLKSQISNEKRKQAFKLHKANLLNNIQFTTPLTNTSIVP